MTDAERLEQIRRSHASARPKHDNPAWVHTHNDLTFVLEQLDSALLRLSRCLNKLRAIGAADCTDFANRIEAESRAVEKPVRICGVPDPDDECEECHRPLGHDGEHDYTTPPE